MTPKCEVCGSYLLCESDAPFGYGKITYVHEGPCVPPTPIPLPSDEEKSATSRECTECGKRFTPGRQAKVQVVCSSECRKARRARQKEEAEKRRGKYWRLRVLNDPDLPTKQCRECGRLFTLTNRLAANRDTCSAMCKRLRNSRKQKAQRNKKRAA